MFVSRWNLSCFTIIKILLRIHFFSICDSIFVLMLYDFINILRALFIFKFSVYRIVIYELGYNFFIVFEKVWSLSEGPILILEEFHLLFLLGKSFQSKAIWSSFMWAFRISKFFILRINSLCHTSSNASIISRKIISVFWSQLFQLISIFVGFIWNYFCLLYHFFDPVIYYPLSNFTDWRWQAYWYIAFWFNFRFPRLFIAVYVIANWINDIIKFWVFEYSIITFRWQ